MDCNSVMLFGASPIVRRGGGDAGGCSKQVLAVNAEWSICDNMFGAGFEGGGLFESPARNREKKTSLGKRYVGAGAPFRGESPEKPSR